MGGGDDDVPVRMEGVLPFARADVWGAFRRPQDWWGREAKVAFRKGGRYHVRQGAGWLKGKIVKLWPGRRLTIRIPFETVNVSFETTLTVNVEARGKQARVAFEHVGPPIMTWMGETRELQKFLRETLVKLANYLKGAR